MVVCMNGKTVFLLFYFILFTHQLTMIRNVLSRTTQQNKSLVALASSKEYLPWANEHSACGTTYEVLFDAANAPARTKVGDDLIHLEPLWENSSANRDISLIDEETKWLTTRRMPSSIYYHAKPPPLREGLYKPMKKPAFSRLE
ncbi:hypothetical protein BC940DRAFT_295469 [Gongronella butleri]|nr:hypothetical protein BC940DRAFT_295469 [Gongronella butleri]